MAKAAARLHTLPGNHPLTQRLRQSPPRGWSRLDALAKSQPPPEEPPDEMWRPRLPALRNWLAPSTEKQTHQLRQWTLPPESDPELYWASNKPHSLMDQPWYKDNNPYLGLLRKYLTRWVGERTGHWNFHSYHDRFNYPHPQDVLVLNMWSTLQERTLFCMFTDHLPQPERGRRHAEGLQHKLHNILHKDPSPQGRGIHTHPGTMGRRLPEDEGGESGNSQTGR
ncbi:hypothetical protein SMACR_04108 [Sordaria macrospora]|uniref:Uncharacterized protein n=2 Tax=Sordaria macrospora TaxID=5147 RepID=A0A8S8ZMN9_SORMA|nr:hypothetical protein SMACR_04108 [Sordaria macrospora]